MQTADEQLPNRIVFDAVQHQQRRQQTQQRTHQLPPKNEWHQSRPIIRCRSCKTAKHHTPSALSISQL